MKKIITSLLSIFVVASLSAGATQAFFEDSETSTGNTFSAGSIDLTVDGNNGVNTVEFTVNNMMPGNQPHGSYLLANVGTTNGYLNMFDISVVDTENGCVEPETTAGDSTCANPGSGDGELGDVINLRLWVDRNGDGWISAGEPVLYNGDMSLVPSTLTFNEPLNAAGSTKVGALVDWWSGADDNKAQGDSAVLNMSFKLSQNSI